MSLSKKAIEDYKNIIQKERNIEITYEEASDGANRMLGLIELLMKFKVEEDARKEKLKEFPKGFELGGRGRTCFICKDSNYGDGTNWYDKYGLKCMSCQASIDRGEIDPELIKDDKDWYSKYDLESIFNLKAPTLRSWVKQGILKERSLMGFGNRAHVRLYLIADNKDFLPPKYMVKPEIVRYEKDDKVYSTLEPWYKFVDPHEHLKGYKIMDYVTVGIKDED